MGRMIALLILVIPGLGAALGIKWMRDALFGINGPLFSALWLQFLAGLALFAAGLAFLGGFLLHRDRKRNKVQARFQRKRKTP
ncbi:MULTISPECIES: DUF2627 domain-containing protein [Geobacillus]|uniref:DUF2627 domain-containing protein n=9 Tax=Geobacillus TaxID=129337 RepID=A0A1Q5ST37_9BACL|nr:MULTISPECIES: DUF2627 domain-containing protein [Geobacillus]AEV19978.1 hypothetical protein GTCCBUS3UF5_26750 [Geobacillus thermoleovorans CCB_US3_UF5]AMV11511.1 hypothetical protein GT3570_11315 [Geobacillus thermoleovorans]AOL35118.1 hypothetical protein BGM21_11730 [Geobacillus thermoleovorans]AUI37920.1 DUF2627 domain-containing protein [[Bacillus] caldolyticus]AWO75483.1 DUF2627 domain-containing protein [Geobacillus thermoleovorans]